MKYGVFYILLLLPLLTSCGRQHAASESLQPDSARVAWIFYKKIWATSTLDSAKGMPLWHVIIFRTKNRKQG